MGKRLWISIGVIFAVGLAWAWLGKPRSLHQEFELAGVQLVPIQPNATSERKGLTFYTIPLRQEILLVDVLRRTGFREGASGRSPSGLRFFTKKTDSFFGHDSQNLVLIPETPNLRIQSNFNIR